MKDISISKFKAECLAILDRVDKTRESVVVTKFGIPIAEVVPVKKQNEGSWLGCMQGKGSIEGDLVESDFSEDWESIRK